MEGKNNESFWPSYVDIMTTLFAITLVLFAVSFSRFKIKEKQLKSLVDEYENIITVYSTVGTIDSTSYFGYNEQYLKHLFTVDVQYQQKEYRVDKLMLDLYDTSAANAKRDSILNAGRLIQSTLRKLEKEDAVQGNIKFLVVIEGQSSKVRFEGDDWRNNYTLSYLRAQFLNNFWKANGIDLSTLPRCELIIAGSGEAGVPRITPDTNLLINNKQQWLSEEIRNQRFLIHIVPVIGNIDVTKARIEYYKGER